MSGSAQVIANIYKWAAEKKIGCEAVSRVNVANMENYAKVNKTWQDITGNARAGLHGGYFWENTEVLKMFIAHSMSYGVYLELAGGGNKRENGVYIEMANDGKYAILQPTIRKFQDTWFKNIKRIIEK